MENLKDIGAIVGLVADVFIFLGILKGSIKEQNFSTWLLWGLLDGITATTIILRSGNYKLVAIYAICSLSIALLLLIKKEIKWGLVDWLTTGGIVICLVVWICLGNKATTVVGTIGVVISGAPLIKSTYFFPEHAPTRIYALFCIASGLSLLGAKDWSIEESLYAEATLCLSIVFTLLSIRKPKLKRPIRTKSGRSTLLREGFDY